MAVVQQVNIHCECYHRRGLLYVLRPWVWGRPCRRCRRMMDRSVVVMPTTDPSAVTVIRDRAYTTTQAINVPQQVEIVTPAQTALDWQASEKALPSALPPKYDMVAAN